MRRLSNPTDAYPPGANVDMAWRDVTEDRRLKLKASLKKEKIVPTTSIDYVKGRKILWKEGLW